MFGLYHSAFGDLTWGNVSMLIIGGLLLYLGIARKMEPILLVPIGFGIFIVNLPLGGLMVYTPEGVPAAWTVYFGVTDADRTIERAGELGGALVQGPDDTPYGRLAEVTDPNGARFRIVQP